MNLDPTAALLVWAGVAAPFIYAVTVAVGAAIRPGYSHVRNAVSELVEAGAPNRGGLNLAFLLYNLLIVAFAVGILRAFDDPPVAVALSAWFLGGTGVAGALMWFFPMDPIGSRATVTGIGHLVLAGLLSLGTMAAVLAFAIGAGAMAGWADFSIYSYASFGVILATGALAATAAARRWRVIGLLERITIGAGLQWVAVLAFTLLARG